MDLIEEYVLFKQWSEEENVHVAALHRDGANDGVEEKLKSSNLYSMMIIESK